jgi:hypothetical protein
VQALSTLGPHLGRWDPQDVVVDVSLVPHRCDTDAIPHGGRCRGHTRGHARARSTVTRSRLAGQQPHHQCLRICQQRFVLVDEFTRDEPDLLRRRCAWAPLTA